MRLRAYDNGGKTADRYTVLDMDEPEHRPDTFFAIAAGERPFHPQGFGQCCSATPGRHLGKRVLIQNLPPDVQKFVKQTFGSEAA